MRIISKYLLLALLTVVIYTKAQKPFSITGTITNKQNKAVEGALVQVLNSNYNAVSDSKGSFKITIPHKQHLSVLFKHTSYVSKIREFDINDSTNHIQISIVLTFKEISLDSVTIKAINKPDTLVYSGKFSIYDFDFYEDKYILLTSQNELKKSEIKLADDKGKILSTTKIPEEAGLAKELFHDYMGYTNVICENAIYRIIVYNNAFIIFSLNAKDFNSFVKPIIDTVNNKLIFSDYWKEYPSFNYYSYSQTDKTKNTLISITNEDLMSIYNMEYYYMKPKDKLEAREIADEYKIDKKVAAALMTGFTKSLFYDPLYAPLFILKDTICVFDHYKDALFHFDKQGKKLDSIAISYNHPKNWREWKHLMLKDDIENAMYAVYAKDGHKYIKLINYTDGKEKGKYKLIFHSGDKVKIRDGYIYYVYRPFESTQEKFLYRERITLNNKN